MKRLALWTAGVMVGLWLARELRGARNHPATRTSVLDLNQCSRESLLVAGLTEVLADRIIENRPYRHRLDLVARMVVPSGVYENIRQFVDVDGGAAGRSVNVAS